MWNASDRGMLHQNTRGGEKECNVLLSCGKSVCLSMNPKANFQNGWTVKAKQTRKRKATTGETPREKRPRQQEARRIRKIDFA